MPGPDLQTPIDGLLLSKTAITPAAPEYSLTEPLLVVMAQGGKRLLLGDQIYEYGAGDCLVVTANLPVTGHWIDTDRSGQRVGHGRGAASGRHRRATSAGAAGPVVARDARRAGDRDRQGQS